MVDVPEVDWIKMHPVRNLETINRKAAKSATKCYRNLAIRDTTKRHFGVWINPQVEVRIFHLNSPKVSKSVPQSDVTWLHFFEIAMLEEVSYF